MKHKKEIKPWYKRFWIWLLIFSCLNVLFDDSTSIWEKLVICICIVLLIVGNTDKKVSTNAKIDTATPAQDISKTDKNITDENSQTQQIEQPKTKVGFLDKIKEKREQKRN